jgi:lysozyme
MLDFLRRSDGTIHPAVKVAGAGAAWVAIAVATVGPFEGLALRPYVDHIGTGHPETWCYGETKADGPPPPYSKVFTKAECQADLGKDLVKYDAQVHTCIKVALPPHREAALVSFTYNLGVGALCHSAVARNLNAGNVSAGCHAMLAYDHAAGVRVAGLTRRRQAEYQLCMRSD